MRRTMPVWTVGIIALVMWVAGCGSDGGGDQTTRAPERAGDVWEIASPEDRAAAPGSMLAYLYGLQTIVLDGDRLYVGMTRLRGERDAEGALVFSLSENLSASLVPEGEAMVLQFSTGEAVAMKKRGES